MSIAANKIPDATLNKEFSQELKTISDAYEGRDVAVSTRINGDYVEIKIIIGGSYNARLYLGSVVGCCGACVLTGIRSGLMSTTKNDILNTLIVIAERVAEWLGYSMMMTTQTDGSYKNVLISRDYVEDYQWKNSRTGNTITAMHKSLNALSRDDSVAGCDAHYTGNYEIGTYV